MRRRLKHFRRSRRGASAVEFALVLPPFLLMLFGAIEFGRLFWTSHALHETAIATARCMGIPQTECTSNGAYSDSRAAAFARATSESWNVRLEPALVILDHEAQCHGMDGFSSVDISHEFETVVPKLIMALAGGTELRASTCYPNHPN